MISPSEKLDQLRFLSQTHRKAHEQRRQLEIRVLIITLSTFGLSAFGALKGEIHLKLTLTLDIGVWVTYLAFACISAGYLRMIHVANRANIRLAEAAENEIAAMTEAQDFNTIVSELSQKRLNPFWSWGWQVVTIAVVAVASAVLITMGY